MQMANKANMAAPDFDIHGCAIEFTVHWAHFKLPINNYMAAPSKIL
jgi:hypothetical protein